MIEPAANAVTDGLQVLLAEVGHLPGGPGVYRMLGGKGEVLYVGKAKNLKARVVQYTQAERMVARIRKMVFETRSLVVVQTRTEAEALLLEANLIKSLKPKYNIIFRDDASYVSVLITDEASPQIRSYRGARRQKGTYFGPYPSAGAVYATLELMEKVFRLRTCAPGVFAHRSRPCLKFDIKRCSAPCVGKISQADYAASVQLASRFLRGERQAVVAELQARMQQLAAAEAFEAAAVVRDQIMAVSAVVGASTAMSHVLPDADVFALVRVGSQLAVQGFFYRHGQHVGNHVWHPNHLQAALGDEAGGPDALPDAEVLRLFLALHYTQRPPPSLICTNVAPTEAAMLAEALGVSAGRRVVLEVPVRGEKRQVMEQAEANAKAALQRKHMQEDGWAAQMAALGQVLGLARAPELVECYDISNISGRYPVASGVVAGPTGMLRGRYRRYHVKTLNTPDDYAMLREVLTRRLQRGLKEGGLPEVLLVDGGKGQLNVLRQVAEDVGLWGEANCPKLVGIAKGEERDKGLETLWLSTEDGLEQLPIVKDSALIFLLQKIRDEAHRFAITFHRTTRAKGLTNSVLDGVAGLGPAKRKALLLHFGSVSGVAGADVATLAQVPGIGAVLAQLIYDRLHG
jgi:excinuclease ABC subunit C